MRLLNTQKPGLEFEEFYGEDIPSYAIRSHTWYSGNQEVSYQDIRDGKGQDRLGYAKILNCKSIASDYKYCWIDTCCIDKTSSAELSEAINSMYSWYEKAAVCYVFLSDVSLKDHTESFKNSRWFTRGWTLQELIAPDKLVFYSKDWERLFERREVLDIISNITAIPINLLSHSIPLAEFSVAQRMSWAADRTTTRIEDEAYSLMGLFGVNMPLHYGEKEKAFRRLQEEIIKTTDDQSLFAWAIPNTDKYYVTGLLAARPKYFADSKNIHSMGIWGKGNVIGVTNRGIRAKLYMIPPENDPFNIRVSLDCWTDSRKEQTYVILLRRLGVDSTSSDTAHETPFARLQHSSYTETVSKHLKSRGEYKEIYVRDVPFTQNKLSLSAIDWLLKCFYVKHPGRSFSVCPIDCWEPQTNIFTIPRNGSGTFGAIYIPTDYCIYIAYFGSDRNGRIWVRADFMKSTINNIDDDIWMSYQMDGKETCASEISHSNLMGPNNYTERFIVKAMTCDIYNVLTNQIVIFLNRVAPEEAEEATI